MTADKPATTSASRAPAGRKLLRIKGVRARPGGTVRLAELVDGWATFPDYGANGRRWQRIGVVALVALFIAEYLVERVQGSANVQGILALSIIGLVVLLIASNEISSDRAILARWRDRKASTLRAGGPDALRQALSHQERTRTVGELNVLLSSMGRTDPVFSLKRVRNVRVRTHWWHTTVELELTTETTITYRVLGVRAPGRLARVFGPTGFRPTSPQATKSRQSRHEA